MARRMPLTLAAMTIGFSALSGAGIALADDSDPGTAEQRADVALHASPESVELSAQRGAAAVKLAYYNPGDVPKVESSITAEIPDGLTVEPRPAPGWECHISDFPALVCATEMTLEPGAVTEPAEVVLTAEAPLTTEIEFGTLGFYRNPTENPADNYSTVSVTVT